MAIASYRIAQMVAPHVTLSDSLEEAVARSLASEARCPIERCVQTLRSFGEMGCRLRDDPKFLNSLVANDATVRPHPAVREFVKWLNDGTDVAFRLKVPPVVVTVVRAPYPAVLQVVEYRKAIQPRVVPFISVAPPDHGREIPQLALAMIGMAEAAAGTAGIRDPARRGILLELIIDIGLAVAHATSADETGGSGPEPQRQRVRTIANILRRSDPCRIMSVSLDGLEIGFRRGGETDGALPFRIVAVRDGV